MMARRHEDVPGAGSLPAARITREWQAVPLSGFSLDSFHAAVRDVLPDAPRDARALEALINGGQVSVVGARWPDGVVTLIAWRGRAVAPPDDALLQGYRRFTTKLNALRELRDMPAQGSA